MKQHYNRTQNMEIHKHFDVMLILQSSTFNILSLIHRKKAKKKKKKKKCVFGMQHNHHCAIEFAISHTTIQFSHEIIIVRSGLFYLYIWYIYWKEKGKVKKRKVIYSRFEIKTTNSPRTRAIKISRINQFNWSASSCGRDSRLNLFRNRSFIIF